MNKEKTLEVLTILRADFFKAKTSEAERKALIGINFIIKAELGDRHPLVSKHYQIIGKEETGWKFKLDTNLDEIVKLFK